MLLDPHLPSLRSRCSFVGLIQPSPYSPVFRNRSLRLIQLAIHMAESRHVARHPFNRPTRKLAFPRSMLDLMAILGLAALILFSGPATHALGWLPLALLPASPLLHMFHHGGRHSARAANDRDGIGQIARDEVL